MDLRYNFPLEWYPSVSHKGFEDLSFAPGFDDVASPEYHSYLILWWLDGKVALTADKLQAEMVTYFRGWLSNVDGTITSRPTFRW